MTEDFCAAQPMAQAILAQHGRRFPGFDRQPTPVATSNNPVYLGALEACSALGFIAADAHCLANAWAAQTRRTGHFAADTWPSAPQDFGLQSLPRQRAFAHCPPQLGLYAVLPDAQWVARMAAAGVPTVQLRFKSEDPVAVQKEVRAAVKAVQGTHARLFINDHWRIALAEGAYGIHLGQEDLDALQPENLEQMRQAGVRLGVSTHGYAEMVRADAVGPSYIAMGAVFPTTLKRMATAPQGLERLKCYARLMHHYPLVAIGGIGAEQFKDVLATGVGSIAVVRALVSADQPEVEAAQLMQAMATANHR